MSIITYPLDGKYYNAQDAETYLCTRTSGVFSQDISFTPNGMNITVSPFLAWIKNDDFSGKSVAVTTDTTLTISPSEPILSRIDRIVLRFDARKNGSELMVLKGTPSSSPAVPSIERTPVIYDLCLCQISVKPSATSISAGDITSTLLDESLCGIMRDGVTGIPTLQLQSQAQDLIRELEVAISMAENGSPVLQSLGIKRGTVDVTIGTEGQKIYKSNDVTFDTTFLDTPKVIVTRKYHYLNDTVFKYIKPQESVSANALKFSLEVFSENDIPSTLTLRYDWIAIGKVSWDNDSGGGNGGGNGGGGDGGGEEDDTEYFTISTSVDPAGSGITEGAGNFAKGSTTKLVARAFSGYMFEGWYSGNSKVTSNAEYTVTVNSNATYTAKFIEAVPSIVVQINVEPVGTGTVSGAGTYEKGSTVNLGATPKDGYRFVGWYVGSTKYASTADYSVTLNASTTFTARFEEEVVTPDYYTVIAKVTPTGSGTVTGGGQYVPGATAKLKATANEGYVFSHWSSGTETINSAEFTFVVSSNRTWTAHFIEGEEETGKVTITTRVEPANSGTVTGGGEVTSGSMSAVQANANSGYKFKHWRFEDGTTKETNPYLFKANTDKTLVAVFEVDSGGEETVWEYTIATDGSSIGISAYNGTDENVIIPSTIDGYVVTTVLRNAFSNKTFIKTVTFPTNSSFKIISGASFSGCTELQSINISNNVTNIFNSAFDSCDKLTTINYNGTKAEWNNVSMNNVFEDLTVLTVHCTDGDVNYAKLDISVSPEGSGSVTTSPKPVTATTGNTFYVKATADVQFTDKANSGYKFSKWIFLDGEETSTKNPISTTVPINTTMVAVFEVDSGEEETTYTKDTQVGSVLYVGTEETGIETNYRYESTDMTEIVIPEGRTTIAKGVFGNCTALTKVTMPSTMASIGGGAFGNCTNLTEITYNGTKSQWNNISKNRAFDGDLDDITIHCTDGDVNYVKMTISVSPEGSGSVTTSPTAVTTTTGDTFYVEDSRVNLIAAANERFIFKAWREPSGEEFSEFASQTITASAGTWVAVFINVANGVTYKISSRNAGTGDTIGLYPYSYSTDGVDLSKPLGTETTLYVDDPTVVFWYAKPGSNRTVSSVEALTDGVLSDSMSGEDLNDYIENGALSIQGGWYDPDNAGKTFELVVYFGETVEKKTITFSNFHGTTKVVCNGVELSNSRNHFTHEFNTGDEITLTFTPDSGYRFSSWVNDDTASKLSDDNPWTFTVDSSTVRKIGIIYSQT